MIARNIGMALLIIMGCLTIQFFVPLLVERYVNEDGYNETIERKSKEALDLIRGKVND